MLKSHAIQLANKIAEKRLKMLSASTHVVEATAEHTHTIIFLHGRDSLAKEFASELFESQGSDDKTLQEALPHHKWVFPQAGISTASRFDCEMSQWFDIWCLKHPSKRCEIQAERLRRSRHQIMDIVKREAAIVGYSRVYLAGISQGCAVASHVLLKLQRRLGGFIGLSGWLPFEQAILRAAPSRTDSEPELSDNEEAGKRKWVRQDTPVFLAHCEDDDVVAHTHGRALRRALVHIGFKVEWRSYEEGGHWLNEPKGVDDLVRFIRK